MRKKKNPVLFFYNTTRESQEKFCFYLSMTHILSQIRHLKTMSQNKICLILLMQMSINTVQITVDVFALSLYYFFNYIKKFNTQGLLML